MENDPEDLGFDRAAIVVCIFPDTIDTDIYFCCYGLAGFGKGEGNNIGKVVMPKELAVYFEQALIRDENILQLGEVGFLPFKKGGERLFDFLTAPQANFLQKMKPDGRGDCHNFTGPRYVQEIRFQRNLVIFQISSGRRPDNPIEENEEIIRVRTGNHCQDPFI